MTIDKLTPDSLTLWAHRYQSDRYNMSRRGNNSMSDVSSMDYDDEDNNSMDGYMSRSRKATRNSRRSRREQDEDEDDQDFDDDQKRIPLDRLRAVGSQLLLNRKGSQFRGGEDQNVTYVILPVRQEKHHRLVFIG